MSKVKPELESEPERLSPSAPSAGFSSAGTRSFLPHMRQRMARSGCVSYPVLQGHHHS